MSTHRAAGAACLILACCLAGQGCRESAEAKAGRYLEQGRQHLARGDAQRATLAFRNAARAVPTSAEPQHQLGLALLAQGNSASAATLFQVAIQLDPRHAGALVKLAELLAASRDQDAVRQAASLARQALEIAPGNLDAVAALALADLRLGNAEAAEKATSEALRKEPGHAGLAVNLARSRAARNDASGAERALRDAIAAAPRSLELALALGEYYLGSNRPALAEPEYRRALELNPAGGAALAGLARTLAAAGRLGEAEQAWRKAAGGPDKRYSTAYALYLAEQGRTDDARNELERVVKADEADIAAARLLADSYIAAKRASDAAALLDRALARTGDDAELLQQRASVRLAMGDFDRAEADVQRVMRLQPASGQTHYLLARVYRARGDGAGVARELGEALRLEAALVEARIELSALMLNGGKARDALKLIDEAPAAQKQLLPMVLQRNWAMLALGRREEAGAVAAAVLASARVPEALLQSAAVHLQRREFSAARVEADEALLSAPDDPRALEVLASAYAGMKQQEAGLARIRQHVAGRPDNAALRAWLGRLLLAQGQPAEARRELEAAAPHLPTAALDLADLDFAEGRFDAASQRLTALLPGDRDGSVAARLGEVEHRRGNLPAAVARYREAVERNPRHVAALNNLAYLLADSAGRADEALRYAQQAKELAPDDRAVDDTLGWTYYQKGLYSLAVRHFENGGSVRSGDPRRQYHLAMAYLRSGDQARGRATLEAALRAHPGLPEAEAARRVLEETRPEASPQEFGFRTKK